MLVKYTVSEFLSAKGSFSSIDLASLQLVIGTMLWQPMLPKEHDCITFDLVRIFGGVFSTAFCFVYHFDFNQESLKTSIQLSLKFHLNNTRFP